ncbi:hypothetical protein HYPSUDRAFT_197544 [Hypholoma sublateritium FD-334 SS-4]|uniref:Uncharacterized protein n=1 Tax=Hypholoma sublateritium (strain FD-334 SS-4) TaxID=945553 RepID=A0A0D2LJU2_HYPSF|nr:hypothetical protein HYPSUDRAFT_197544 [Hypholoma sublateritium FD-334 SS-4]
MSYCSPVSSLPFTTSSKQRASLPDIPTSSLSALRHYTSGVGGVPRRGLKCHCAPVVVAHQHKTAHERQSSSDPHVVPISPGRPLHIGCRQISARSTATRDAGSPARHFCAHRGDAPPALAAYSAPGPCGARTYAAVVVSAGGELCAMSDGVVPSHPGAEGAQQDPSPPPQWNSPGVLNRHEEDGTFDCSHSACWQHWPWRTLELPPSTSVAKTPNDEVLRKSCPSYVESKDSSPSQAVSTTLYDDEGDAGEQDLLAATGVDVRQLNWARHRELVLDEDESMEVDNISQHTHGGPGCQRPSHATTRRSRMPPRPGAIRFGLGARRICDQESPARIRNPRDSCGQITRAKCHAVPVLAGAPMKITEQTLPVRSAGAARIECAVHDADSSGAPEGHCVLESPGIRGAPI